MTVSTSLFYLEFQALDGSQVLFPFKVITTED